MVSLSGLMTGLRRVSWQLSVSSLAVFFFCAGPTMALSGGRVYEMVSPIYKAGNGVGLEAVAPDGESVTFTSEGAFAELPVALTGNAYVAHRHAGSEWVTKALQPLENSITDFSSALSDALGQRGSAAEFQFTLHDLELPDTVSTWETVGPVIVNNGGAVVDRGASADLCHIIVQGHGLLLGAPDSVNELYDDSRGCTNGQAEVRLVSVTNGVSAGGIERVINECEPVVGGADTTFDAVSGDGSEVFFTANVEQGGHLKCSSDAQQLFVRLGDFRTVEVSRPVDVEAPFDGCGTEGEIPCAGAAERAPASFAGASEDGSLVYFTTTASLVSGDTDSTNNLYVARIGCPMGEQACEVSSRQIVSLTRVSQAPDGGADVFGVLDVAPSGAIYFVAHGALAATANDEGEVAVDGADNLYGYDPQTGELKFIADLCSGPAASGSTNDVYCPRQLEGEHNDSGLWGPSGEAQVSEDGRFLVFTSFAQLVRHGPDADTGTSSDIYRFDMASGALERISAGEGGNHGNGNFDGFADDATITPGAYGGQQGSLIDTEHEMSTRAISGDGSWVVFSSAAPLSVLASNGRQNVYAWHETPGSDEGTVSLISSGTATTNDIDAVIAPETTPDGRDIFFVTSAGLVPQDTENDLDVYDARIGGGFPQVAVAPARCSSDACQGPLTAPMPLLLSGSAAQSPGGNWPPPPKKQVKAKKQVKPKKKQRKVKGKAKRQRGKGATVRGHGSIGGAR